MIKLFVFAFTMLTYVLVCAQQPQWTKKWDKRFGGSDNDGFVSFQQTNDGGYILGGTSLSDNNGDKTQPSQGDWDGWVVKIDSSGNKEWDRRFGGTDGDGIGVMQQTKDGGYILGGTSHSGNNGDKTQPSWGGGDYWIVKIDSLGNKQWDKRFGGTSSDFLYALQQTNDRGYILGGLSNSGLNGDKTQDNWDTSYFHDDGWIVKVDSLGNKQWDKRFGGANQDDVVSLQQTNDGGYIVGCYSASDVSDDKTQPGWGASDYWVIKTDSFGNKQWDKTYGGTDGEYLHSLIKTADGGYVLGGYSYSGIGGNKSDSTAGYWIVKVDSAGNKQWDKAFSGIGTAELYQVSQTNDKGYLLSGRTPSNAGGDKSENNLGSFQTWIVKTDSLGNKQWDKTILTTGFDGFGEAIENDNGCYVIAVGTNGGIGGYKTQPNWGVPGSDYDYWVVKFCWEIPDNIFAFPEPESGVTIYPNPFNSDIAISLQKENLTEATFTISNMQGEVIFHSQETNIANSYTKMLDLSYLQNGVYIIEVIIEGEKELRKLVKAK